MKLTLQSVEGFNNKFTLEVEEVREPLDAIMLQRAICRSAIEYVRKFNGVTSIMPSLLMEMKVLLEEKDLLELEQEGDPLADFIRSAPSELKGTEVFIDVKSFLSKEIIEINNNIKQQAHKIMELLEKSGLKDTNF